MVKKEEEKGTWEVVTIADYIQPARDKYGPDNIWKNAFKLMLEEHDGKQLVQINHKGEDLFGFKL